MSEDINSVVLATTEAVEKKETNEIGENPAVVLAGGKIEKPLMKEDRLALKEKIDLLREQIEEYSEKLSAANKSKEIYKVDFSTLIGDVEVTPELLEKKKKELEEAKAIFNKNKPVSGGFFKKAQKVFSIIFPF